MNLFKKIIRKYHIPHAPRMVTQKYTETTCIGKRNHSRDICTICGWTDYDSLNTFHKIDKGLPKQKEYHISHSLQRAIIHLVAFIIIITVIIIKLS